MLKPILESDPKQVSKQLTAADIWIMPQPKEVAVIGEKFDLKTCKGIRLAGFASKVRNIESDFPEQMKLCCGIQLEVSSDKPETGYIVLGLFIDGKIAKDFKGITDLELEGLGDQGYVLKVDNSGIIAAATGDEGLFYATRTIEQIATDRTDVPGLFIRDFPSIKYRGAHEDISRGQVPTMDTFKRLIRILSLAKGNMLELYIEHLFKWSKYPDIGPQEAIEPEEGKELFNYGARYYIEVHPDLQVLGHSYGILHLPQYQKYRIGECKATPWCMTFDIRKLETLDFINELIKEICETFPSKILNVDITEVDIDGLHDTGTTTEQVTELVFQYVLRLRDMIKPYGLRLAIAQGPLDSTGHLAGLGPFLDKLPKDVIISSYYTVEPGAY
jgi:hexosaminidase